MEIINVLFIAGAGRGGSTLLGDALGMLPGAFHIGELRGVFDYTVTATMSCSCQNQYIACPFWGPIFEALYGKLWQQNIQLLRMEGRAPRSLCLPILSLRKLLQRDFKLPLQENIREVIRLLELVQRRTEFQVLVDSSKSASFSWLLAQQPEVRMAVVHLVRDPRASLFSWIRRPIPIFDRETRRAVVRTRTLLEGVQYWVRATMAAYILKVLGMPYMRIKYEEFVAQPAIVVERIALFARRHGIPLNPDEDTLSYLRQRYIVMGERHLLGGNPGVKSRSGVVAIKEDTAWLHELSISQRLLWTLIFLPWILWLGYDLWPEVRRSNNQSD